MPVGNEHSASIDTSRMSVECDDMHSVKVLDEESKSHFNPKYRFKSLLSSASNCEQCCGACKYTIQKVFLVLGSFAAGFYWQ
ncbi:hypothetical protein GOP47_0008792 [Adiantum capillus-veneris]|uniref:Uncharacterized protein n=1 Tax=Adiantum capillus-veneris TaxID=13818 RepID=A0A9D4UZT1_ADICA|nr:hypothetical protein GOP47_0008792 [Adiantum capillus-veneris]